MVQNAGRRQQHNHQVCAQPPSGQRRVAERQIDGSGVADADSASRPKPQTPSLSVTEWGHFKLSRRGQLKLSFPCVATNGG